jgi:hypothetical protein
MCEIPYIDLLFVRKEQEMKRYVGVVFILLCIVGTTFAQNLLVNGDFQASDPALGWESRDPVGTQVAPGVITGWREEGNANNQWLADHATTTNHDSGLSALAAGNQAYVMRWEGARLMQNFPCLSEKTFDISIDVMVSTIGNTPGSYGEPLKWYGAKDNNRWDPHIYVEWLNSG